jgi:metal-responsive CopG/Arc/MetJ family transcriptional regulator
MNEEQMSQRENTVILMLNQQQLELIDLTMARVGAANREDVVRIALREFFARYDAARAGDKAEGGAR